MECQKLLDGVAKFLEACWVHFYNLEYVVKIVLTLMSPVNLKTALLN